MKKLLYIALLLGSPVFGQNINFIKSYGNLGYDIAKDIKQDVDTGYVCTGGSSSFGSPSAEAFLLKVDSMGNFMWSYNYGGNGTEWGEAVVVTNDSTYALAGYSNTSGNGGFDFYLVKTNNVGVPEFETTYGGSDWDKAYGLVQLADSGYVLVGETYSYGSGNLDVYMVRTDKAGDTLWTRVFGGPEDDYARDVILDGDSLVIVGGTESFGAGMSDGLILKYHIDGTFGWSQYVGKERDDYFTSIKLNSAGDEYFLGGSRLYYFDQTGWLNDFWIYNMMEDGALIADTSMTGGSHDVEIAHDITVDPGDNIFYAGQTKSFGHSLTDGHPDAFLGKLQNNYFQAPYVNNFGQLEEDVAYGIDYCYDDGIVACGKIKWQSTGGYNMFIAKVDQWNTMGQITVTTEMTWDSITLNYESLEVIEDWKVYPTAVESELNLVGFPAQTQMSIYSMSGQMVYSEDEVSTKVNLDGLEPGLYVLVFYADNRRYTTKIVKR